MIASCRIPCISPKIICNSQESLLICIGRDQGTYIRVHLFLKLLGLGLGYDKVGTTVRELPPTNVLFYIDSSGAIDIHAKTYQKEHYYLR